MRIGRLILDPGAGLAPMAGVTDLPTRLISREMGASFSVTEMLSAKGFLYAPRDHYATVQILMRAPHEGVTGLQLFGSDPVLMREAANQLSDAGFFFIDINMGCPAHKIVANGEGSALMKTPELAGRVVRATVAGTHLPVTVKIRSGWDEHSQNAVEIARISEAEGASAITVHARTRSQMYAGRADWPLIGRVKRAVSIPVVGNGDISSGEDAVRMMDETGCDGVMVGRAAQGNPWIFREILCALKRQPYRPPTPGERVNAALRHADMLAALTGERHAVREMRKHVAWYVSGLRGCAKLREETNRLNALSELRNALKAFAEQSDASL